MNLTPDLLLTPLNLCALGCAFVVVTVVEVEAVGAVTDLVAAAVAVDVLMLCTCGTLLAAGLKDPSCIGRSQIVYFLTSHVKSGGSTGHTASNERSGRPLETNLRNISDVKHC